MDIYIDTDKMKEASAQINSLLEDLNHNYETLFSTFANINEEKAEWKGKAASIFKKTVEIEKDEYFKYVLNLKEYADYLENQANYIEENYKRLEK